ncbi:hypothetical protein [Streptomyces ipomoeae]|uniref:hypothetical protein n=1 Tax=Streptomyces ipomoeae TaxID=103232 RepID=UPI0029B02266|nr:hypothetical protein [Streptomyces ipomoeae]MDX2696232.1 hypothetical protein [Streptomyces ipomoeae]MDX2839353.1 hypothetical protein [Streptomyces ipomoeae]
MAEPPRVHVYVADLKGETPVAVSDKPGDYDLAIDFSWPPDAIAAGLERLFQDGVDSGRWNRADTRHEASPSCEDEAAPHPENGLE